jgi:site-specific recombinase XerD
LFLNAQFKPKAPGWQPRQLEPGVLLDFVLQQGSHYPPGALQSLASALRSFCRFLCVTGRHPRDLSAALPAISGHHREDLPRYLSRLQLKQLLGVSDWLSQRVGAGMARAGLGSPGRGAHLLRRAFATHLVQQGVSLKAVADLLGHASLSTTQVYCVASPTLVMSNCCRASSTLITFS